jgi:hypothetical protein
MKRMKTERMECQLLAKLLSLVLAVAKTYNVTSVRL